MGYQITGPWQSRVLAAVFPPLEFVTGLFFAAGLVPFVTGPVLLGMLVVFSIAIIVSLARKTDNDCGCSSSQTKVSPVLLARNAVLAALVVAGLFSNVPTYEGAIVIVPLGGLLVLTLAIFNYRALGK